MSGLGWAIGTGLVVLAVAAVSSSSGGQTTIKENGTDARFTIKRNVIDPKLALPLSTFQKGDVLSVTLHDSKNNVDLPFLVTINKVMKDGIDAVYNGMKTVEDLLPGTHFVVYPQDVLLRMPSATSDVPLEHVLDAGDVAMGPAAFAALTGFSDVTDFELFNKGTFVDEAAASTDAGQPGIYVAGSIPFLNYRRVTPWTVGTKALVKKQPVAADVPPFLLYTGVTGESGFGGSGKFGGSFGQKKASVGYDYANIRYRQAPERILPAPPGTPPVPVPFNAARAPDPKSAHAIARAIGNMRVPGAIPGFVPLAPDGTFRTLADFARYYPGAPAMLRTLQVFSGITPDGIYGPQTQRAFDYFYSNDTRPDGSSGPLFTPFPRTGSFLLNGV